MYSIEDLEDVLGLSEWQVRRRIGVLSDLLQKHRGDHNKVLISDRGLELLRRLQGLRKSGLTNDEAVKEIRGSLDNGDGAEGTESESKGNHQVLREQIETLKQYNEELRKDKKYLQERVENLEQKLITGENGENKKDDFKELSLFQVIKKWFATET